MSFYFNNTSTDESHNNNHSGQDNPKTNMGNGINGHNGLNGTHNIPETSGTHDSQDIPGNQDIPDTHDKAKQKTNKKKFHVRFEIAKDNKQQKDHKQDQEDDFEELDPESSLKEKSEQLVPGSTLAEMPRLSPTQLRKAFGLLDKQSISDSNASVNKTNGNETSANNINFHTHSASFIKSLSTISTPCAIFENSEKMRFWVFSPIVLSNKDFSGMQPLEDVLNNLEASCNKDSVPNAKKGPTAIITIGEEVKLYGMFAIRHFITLKVNTNSHGRVSEACIYDSNTWGKSWIVSNLNEQIANTFAGHLSKDDHFSTFKNLFIRHYVGSQETFDHNSCGYQTFKIVRTILNGEEVDSSTKPNELECSKIIQFINEDSKPFLDSREENESQLKKFKGKGIS